MPTITWKEVVNGGTQIIRLDERGDSMPKEGEEKELNGRRYKVVGLGTAEVLLEPLEPPPADPANPAMKDGKPVVPTAAERARAAGQPVPVDVTNRATPRDAGPDAASLARRNERVAERRDAEAAAAEKAAASRHPDHKPAPHHVPQRRHSDPLARTKVVSHKKK